MEISIRALMLFMLISVLIDLAIIAYFYEAAQKKYSEKKEPWWINFHVEKEHHIIPVNDRYAHTPSDKCGCSPKSTAYMNQEGEWRWTVKHNALDGRD